MPQDFIVDCNVDLVTKAAMIAHRCHIDQKRKHNNSPYFTHCAMVSYLVSTVADHLQYPNRTIAAAYLHDVVEDGHMTLYNVAEELDPYISVLVRQLTKVSSPDDGDRGARFKVDLAHLMKASHDAKVIKLADISHNLETIVSDDAGFSLVYLPEKIATLRAIKSETNSAPLPLYDIALKRLKGCATLLEHVMQTRVMTSSAQKRESMLENHATSISIINDVNNLIQGSV